MLKKKTLVQKKWLKNIANVFFLSKYPWHSHCILTLSVTVVTVLGNHPKFPFQFKKGSSKKFYERRAYSLEYIANN